MSSPRKRRSDRDSSFHRNDKEEFIRVISDASDVVPAVGAVGTIATFLLSRGILGEVLPQSFILGTGVLVLGTILLSHFRFTKNALLLSAIAGVLFGMSSVLTKALFRETEFLNGFFWTRILIALAALVVAFVPRVFDELHGHEKKSATKTSLVVLGNKLIAALATFLILLAIHHTEVSAVNALGGAQFIFLFLFAFILGKRMPEYFTDKVHKHEFLHKFGATLIIVAGFIILFLS